MEGRHETCFPVSAFFVPEVRLLPAPTPHASLDLTPLLEHSNRGKKRNNSLFTLMGQLNGPRLASELVAVWASVCLLGLIGWEPQRPQSLCPMPPIPPEQPCLRAGCGPIDPSTEGWPAPPRGWSFLLVPGLLAEGSGRINVAHLHVCPLAACRDEKLPVQGSRRFWRSPPDGSRAPVVCQFRIYLEFQESSLSVGLQAAPPLGCWIHLPGLYSLVPATLEIRTRTCWSLQHHPTACLLPGQARPPGPPQLCSVQSSLTPLPTTLDLQDPPVFLWGPPEMDRQAGQESLPSALRTHSPPTTAPSASLPWERKRQPLLSEACNFLGTWFADSFLCFLSLCRKEKISNLTQKVEVGQTSRHPREAWETRKK